MKRYTVRCVHFNHYKVKKYFKLFADLKNKTNKRIQALIDLLCHDKSVINLFLFFTWLCYLLRFLYDTS